MIDFKMILPYGSPEFPGVLVGSGRMVRRIEDKEWISGLRLQSPRGRREKFLPVKLAASRQEHRIAPRADSQKVLSPLQRMQPKR